MVNSGSVIFLIMSYSCYVTRFVILLFRCKSVFHLSAVSLESNSSNTSVVNFISSGNFYPLFILIVPLIKAPRAQFGHINGNKLKHII